MNKFLWVFCFLLIALFLSSNQACAISVTNKVINIVNGVVNTSPITYKDLNYHNPATEFFSGAVVYIKFNSSSDGSDTISAWLKNSLQENITNINLERIDNNPYIYVGKFNVPQKEGQYLLVINISGNGNSFSYSQNLSVLSYDKTNNKKKNYQVPKNSQNNYNENSVRSILFSIFDKLIVYLKSLL